MNCDQVREKLIDLVYGELAGPEAAAVEEHLRGCAACRAELARLRRARAALAKFRAGEPEAAPPLTLPAAPRRIALPYRRWIGAAAAVAAVAILAVGVWMMQVDTTPAAYGKEVEIKRLNVSLTILSEPENWPTYYYYGPRGRYRHGWRGLALVRDQRMVRNLKRGETRVNFTDVPSAILPDTVRMQSLARKGRLTILEQNYQYDLASSEAILRKHIDKPVSVLFKAGGTVSGKLLSYDGATLVIQPAGEGPRNVARQEIRALTFAALPEGLLSRPTLVWLVHNTAPAAQQFEVAYMTRGIKWRADYVLKLRPAKVAPAGAKHEIIDTADLVGYATVTNNSGVTYEDAQLKLLAGDVNLIRPEGLDHYLYDVLETGGRRRGSRSWGFKEKSFFEYHLYTLGRATTIRSAETKQIELVSGSGLKLRRGYVYDRQVNATAARVVSELLNSEANGLGRPLPKGVVRLYAPDPQGLQSYVSQTNIDHTPKNEKLRFHWSYAFDIACSAKQIGYRHHSTYDHYEKWQYHLRNRKDHAVTITVIARVPASTYQGNCTRGGRDYPWHVRKVGWVEIDVPIDANSTAKVEFLYRYNHKTGGGLKSPHDE